MADSSPLNILTPKRQKLSTDWGKCIVCQSKKNEILKNATDKSLQTLTNALSERRDDVFFRLENHLSVIGDMNVVWHRSCYQTITSKSHIARSTVKIDADADVNLTKSKPQPIFTLSALTPLDPSLCLFCQKVYCKREKRLHIHNAVDTNLQQVFEDLKDDTMLMRLSTIERTDVKYHLACYKAYMYQSCKSDKASSVSAAETFVNKDPFANAFNILTQEIDSDMFIQGKAFSLKYLLDRFKSLLGDNIDTSSYRTEKLQNKLKLHYGDRVVIQAQRGRSKSSILFSSSITVGQAITAASALKETLSDLSDYCIEDDSDAKSVSSHDTSTLYHSAKILRSMVQSVKDNVQVNQTISNDHVENIIPDNLYMFLRWLLEDNDGENPMSDQKEKCSRQDIHRLILSIAQDIIFASNKSVLTPKHIGIGVTVKHLTGSKEVVKLLNRFGHSISYEEVIKLEKSLVQETLLDYDGSSHLIPSNIVAGKFIQAAADNLDFNEQTLDGKNTTHATTLVLYQRAENRNFGAKVSTKFSKILKPQVEAKLTPDVINFSKQCRKLSLPDCFLKEGTSNEKECSSRNVAKCLDMAWVFARLCPTKHFQVSLEKMETQTVPAWTAFNSLVTSSTTPLTSIGYCPMIPSPATEYSTIYTVMKTVQNMMKTLQQKHTILTFDEAIYCKAKEIQWRCQDEFKETVIRLGGFHTAMTFMSVIGKRYEESGMEDLLVEAGVYGSGSIMKIMAGKSYNKGVRAFKLLMETFSRLRLHSLAPNIKNKTECYPYIDSVMKLRDAIGLNDETACKEAIHDIERHSGIVTEELNALREKGGKESATFGFWDEFIDMVEILLRFIRADREGLWELHIDSLSDMLPYFFAYDRINYARWASVYLADMKSLPHSAAEVYDEFMNGNHPVKRAVGSFNQVWTDLALEQSVNRDSKIKGGIIGSTQQKDTVNRWFVTAHTRASIVSALKAMAECSARESQTESKQHHKESGKLRMERDESDVHKLLETLNGQMLNPFDTNTHRSCFVMNLATGMTSSEEVSKDITTAKEIGEKCTEQFVKRRLVKDAEMSVMDPIRKNKLKTLSFYRTPVKVPTGKLSDSKTIDADRGFFSRLIVVAQSRSVDLKSVLQHELSPVPLSLAHLDGTLRKTQKSKLLHILESEVSTSETPSNSESKYAWIYDGMALVQKTKVTVQTTFGEYADLLLGIVLKTFDIAKCERVDVVFDRYDNKLSIKGSERLRRQKTQGLQINIHGPNTQLPKQWAKFMDVPTSKANLTAFLCNYWVSHACSRIPDGKSLYLAGGFEDGRITKCITATGVVNIQEMYTSQEEADTRMLLHAFNAMDDCPKITIDSPDTDVAVLCVYYFEHLTKCSQLYFYTGTADKRRFIPIHEISKALGSTLSSILPSFHALTGCDSTSSVCKLGKKKPWKILRDKQDLFQDLSCLGDSYAVNDSCKLAIERLFCASFGSKHENVDNARYDMFCRKFTKTEDLPPTKDSLLQHIERANYQTYIWKNALDQNTCVDSPIGHGWEKDGESIVPTLMTKECAPKSLLVVVSCKCIKSECRGRCSCQKEGLPCIDSCSCGARDTCNNPCKMIGVENDSDVETDEEDAIEDEIIQ